MSETILSIMSSGGNGHKVISAHRTEIEKKAGFQVVSKDLMMDILGQYVGGKVIGRWEKAHKTGNIEYQKKLFKKQPYADIGFYIPIFFKTLAILFSMKPVKIINTQVMGLSAMLSALAFYNFIKGIFCKNFKPVKMEMWMTDLVSEEADHFLNPLSKLSGFQKRLLVVNIPNKLKYFMKRTHFNNNQVHKLSKGELPVLKIYNSQELKDKTPETDKPVEFNIQWAIGTDKKDYGNVQKKLVRTHAPNVQELMNGRGYNADMTKYTVQPGDIVYTLMLGSVPNEHIVKDFVSSIRKVAAETSKNIHFFAYCGKDTPEIEKSSLFNQICIELNKNSIDHPKNLAIVPLPFQDPNDIAQVMARSDKKFTTAGGATAFQHLALDYTLNGDRKKAPLDEKFKGGKVCILADVESKNLSQKMKENLYKSILLWEGGNARRLEKKIGAKIVTLDKIEMELKDHTLFTKPHLTSR